jgi:glycosyltransferase involved in cell wall biosynthesis
MSRQRPVFRLKILLVNNFYGSSSPSGEALVLAAERRMLKERGHTISEYYRFSDELIEKGVVGKVRGAFATPWNPFAARNIKQLVEFEHPDVVHAHNTFPLLSPSVFSAITRSARVLSLHNYRLFCPAAIPLRDGVPCMECLQRRSVTPALRYGCYRASRLATLPLATKVALHRRIGTWEKHIDAFIALTDFQRDQMITAGLPAERVHVKPNFQPGNPKVVPWEGRRAAAVYVGRLSAEKGVESLVRAWSEWGVDAPELRVIGDGEQRRELESWSSEGDNGSIKFLGQLSSEDAVQEIASARLLILPSVCFEGFPMVLAEAFASGTAVAVSAIGPLPSIVKEGGGGVTFQAGDVKSLLSTVRSAWETPGELERLGSNARETFESRYTEEANYRMLLEIYESAIEARRSSAGS